MENYEVFLKNNDKLH